MHLYEGTYTHTRAPVHLDFLFVIFNFLSGTARLCLCVCWRVRRRL